METKNLVGFLEESNKIEGIFDDISNDDIEIVKMFLKLKRITIRDISNLVNHFAPGAELRSMPHMNVKTTDDSHVYPRGGINLKENFKGLLFIINENTISPFLAHKWYESIHPFMDGNGRSGRIIWLWMMNKQGLLNYALELGFLHAFYYQSLSNDKKGNK